MTGRLFHSLRRFITDQRGGVSAMLVLMIIPIVAVLGMATEASSWFLTQRAMQNAADSAAVAAASNTCGELEDCHTKDFTPSFVEEAASVAKSYGFTDGAADTTVGTEKKACPADAAQSCYWVTITRVVPINLVRLVGFNGDADLSGGGRGQTVSSLAIASGRHDPSPLCMLSLATTGVGIQANGGGGAFGGCSVGSMAAVQCTQPQNAISVIAANPDAQKAKNCSLPSGTLPVTKPLSDPYAARAPKIPSTNPCTGSGKGQTIGSASGTTTLPLSGTTRYCNGVKLAGDVKVTGSGIILVVDGNFDPGGHRFFTDTGASVTLIFTNASGSLSSGYIEPSSKDALIDIEAPQSGDFSGIAVYTNPALTNTVTWKANGATATKLKVTGAIYMPHASMTFDGSFSKATNSANTCFALVMNDFTGNGSLETQDNCASAGLTPPSGGTAQRQALVQ